MTVLSRRGALGVFLVGATGVPVWAAARPSVRVEPIIAERECHAWVILWGPWLLIECHNNFAQMRERIAGALSESRRFVSGAARADYVLAGKIAELGLVTSSASEGGYAVNTSRAVATLDFTLRAPGRDRALYTTGVVGLVIAGVFLTSPANAQISYGPWLKTNDCRTARAPSGVFRGAIELPQADGGERAKDCKWARTVEDCPPSNSMQQTERDERLLAVSASRLMGMQVARIRLTGRDERSVSN